MTKTHSLILKINCDYEEVFTVIIPFLEFRILCSVKNFFVVETHVLRRNLKMAHPARADFDIFSKGVRGLARGLEIFRCSLGAAAPRLRQAIADCRTSLQFLLLICLGTYFVRELIRQPWLYCKMQ